MGSSTCLAASLPFQRLLVRNMTESGLSGCSGTVRSNLAIKLPVASGMQPLTKNTCLISLWKGIPSITFGQVLGFSRLHGGIHPVYTLNGIGRWKDI